jgi:hypothetical protein
LNLTKLTGRIGLHSLQRCCKSAGATCYLGGGVGCLQQVAAQRGEEIRVRNRPDEGMGKGTGKVVWVRAWAWVRVRVRARG